MMKDYRRMMQQVTLSDRKKEDIMEMIQNKNTRKQKMPHVGKLVLAAALAVGCVLSIAAGLPAQVYDFLSGGSITHIPGSDQLIMEMDASAGDTVTLEDGRLWLNVDGEKLDITDKIDENTPYIVEHTDQKNGGMGYLIVGGTPEDFGWVEIPVLDGEVMGASGVNFHESWSTLPDGTDIRLNDLSIEEQMKLSEEYDGMLPYRIDHYPWFDAALDQLGLEF